MNRAQDNKNFFGGIASKGHKCISDPIEPKSALEPSYSAHAQLSYIYSYKKQINLAQNYIKIIHENLDMSKYFITFNRTLTMFKFLIGQNLSLNTLKMSLNVVRRKQTINDG